MDAIKSLHTYVVVLHWCPEVCFSVGVTAKLTDDAPAPPYFFLSVRDSVTEKFTETNLMALA